MQRLAFVREILEKNIEARNLLLGYVRTLSGLHEKLPVVLLCLVCTVVLLGQGAQVLLIAAVAHIWRTPQLRAQLLDERIADLVAPAASGARATPVPVAVRANAASPAAF